jgi:PKHD-type hydroxylase
MLIIPGVLDETRLRRIRDALAAAPWADGAATAGVQSAAAKHNLQLPEDGETARALGGLILDALSRSAVFMSAALPLRVFPPLFNRYGPGMGFGDHIDNAIRRSRVTGLTYRTDLSGTLFLTDPGDYDGGELVADDGGRLIPVKLAAGDLALYPSSTVHRVETVTRGERLASFFWVQSMVPDRAQRTLLHELDKAIISARAGLGEDHPASVSLTGTYHNLIRMWSQV